jgi:hypothetical protein
VMAGPDTFGLPPKAQPGSILRRQVDPVFPTACLSCQTQLSSTSCCCSRLLALVPLDSCTAAERIDAGHHIDHHRLMYNRPP